jgi:predicted alpha/beta superfamily hydrolase
LSRIQKVTFLAAVVAAAGVSGGLVGGGAAIALVRTAYNGPVQGAELPELVVNSKQLGEPVVLRVHLPREYGSRPDRSFPVFWVLDGPAQGAHTARAAEVLSRAAVTEPLIVVEVPSSSRGRRADLTPPWEGGPADAQADRYFEFLRSEALPAMAQTYRVGEEQVLVGHSLGGLFAIYALLADPLLFEGYFAFSPSVWLGDGAILRELEGAARLKLQAPTSLYLSLGDDEGNEMLSGLESAKAGLASWTGSQLRWHAEITANADHGSNPVLSFPAALRWFSDG